jgi:hypothetical protein
VSDYDLGPSAALQRAMVQRQDDVAPEDDEHPLQQLQREAGNEAVTAALQREDEGAQSPVLDVVGKGGGRPLDSSTRTDMEARFGTDFSDVRLHDDAGAQQSATDVGARAYTTGNEVVLGEGVSLGSQEGQHTLAHELTHVVQQRSGPVSGTPTGDGVSMSDPGDQFEQQAEATAHQVLNGGSADVSGGASSSVQREELDDDELAAAQTLRIQREELAPDDEDPTVS